MTVGFDHFISTYNALFDAAVNYVTVREDYVSATKHDRKEAENAYFSALHLCKDAAKLAFPNAAGLERHLDKTLDTASEAHAFSNDAAALAAFKAAKMDALLKAIAELPTGQVADRALMGQQPTRPTREI